MIETQNSLAVAFRQQFRRADEAGRMRCDDHAAEPDQGPSGTGSGTDDDEAGGSAAMSLSGAMMQRWTQQVASRGRLLRWLEAGSRRACGSDETGASEAMPASVADRHLGLLRRYVEAVQPMHQAGGQPDIPGGAIVVDLDEAVHGGYAAVKDVQVLGNDGWSGIERSYEAGAQEWAQAPLTALQHGAMAATVAELGVNLGVGLPLGVLAWKAAREGYEAVGETRAHGQALKLRSKHLRAQDDAMYPLRSYLLTPPDGAPLAPLDHMVTQSQVQSEIMREDLCTAQRHNRMAAQIGVGSLVSGGSILGKVAITAPMSVGFTAASVATGSGIGGTAAFVAQSATASALATAGGIATSAISLPAAAGAIGLGAVFTKKSLAQRREFMQRSVPAQRELMRLRREVLSEDESHMRDACSRRYCDFVLAKADRRETFYKIFSRMNMGFLAGSAVYGVGAIGTGAAIAVAAALGLSNPIGWGVLGGLGMLGGLVMAANSLQFLRGHHRQQRYDAYLERDDPELDRDFLASVDILTAGADGPDGNRRGVDVRASFYDMLARRDGHRQQFLRDAAADLGRYHVGHVYSTDSAATSAAKVEQAPSLVKRLNALLLGRGKRLLPWRGGFDLASTLSEINAQGRRTYTALSEKSLLRWLGEPQNQHAQLDFMNEALREQATWLQQKNALRQEILEATTPHLASTPRTVDVEGPAITAPDDKEYDAVRAAEALLLRLDRDAERDNLMLAQVTLAQNDISNLRAQPFPARAQMALLKERFLSLHGGQAYNPRIGMVCTEGGVDQAFARSMLGTGSGSTHERMQHLRGMLVDVEMQASEMRIASQTMVDLFRVDGIDPRNVAQAA